MFNFVNRRTKTHKEITLNKKNRSIIVTTSPMLSHLQIGLNSNQFIYHKSCIKMTSIQLHQSQFQACIEKGGGMKREASNLTYIINFLQKQSPNVP